MHCPFCRHPDSRVVDSRTSDDGSSIRRRRQCPNCGRRFTTLETTSLSVVVALLIGTIELWQVLISLLHLRGPVVDAVAALDFGALGYVIVGLFLLAWGLSVALWKFGRLGEPGLRTVELHQHAHAHDGKTPHVHQHVH